MSHSGRNRRKKIRLSCSIESFSGCVSYGYTSDMSMSEALIECGGICGAGKKDIDVGELALFSFSFKDGNKMETFKISCRVMHRNGGAFGLSLLTNGLRKSQKALLEQLLGC